MSGSEIDACMAQLQRERRARQEAEELLQRKSVDLRETERRLALVTRGRLEALTRIGQELGEVQDLDLLSNRIVTEARRLTQAEAGAVFLHEGRRLRCTAVQNERIDPVGRELLSRLGPHDVLEVDLQSLAGAAALTGKTLNVPDAYRLPESAGFRFDRRYDEATGYVTRAVLNVALRGHDAQVIGVLQLMNPAPAPRSDAAVFTEDHEALMTHFATIASGCIERARLVRSMIVRLIRSVALRDRYETMEHAARVADLSVALWQAWGAANSLDDDAIAHGADRLRIAAMLHDVGKVGVSDTILQKQGRLTPAEMAQVRRHTVLGVTLFDAVQTEFDRHARDVILYHHARWDGAGYPSTEELETLRREAPESAGPVVEPRGEGIPLFARIVAVADVFDALISPRVYKRAWSVREALDMIAAEAGSHFDPRIAALLPGVIARREAHSSRAVA